MNDTPPENIKRPDLGILGFDRRVEAAFDRNGVSEKCPFCATDSWLIESFPGCTPAIPMMQSSSGVPLAIIPVVALTCAKCGFLRLHGKRQIDELIGGEDAG